MTRKAPSPRLLAVNILLDVIERGAWSNVALDRVLRQEDRLSPRDAALLTELVYGTLTWLRTIDLLLERQVHRRYATTDPEVKMILRMSAYQFTHLDRIPPRAIVNEAVKVARALGHKIHITRFINGVLRGLTRRLDAQEPAAAAPVLPWMPPPTSDGPPRHVTRPRLNLPTLPKQEDPIGHLAVAWSLPVWIAEQLVAAVGLDRASVIARKLTERAPMMLRLNLTAPAASAASTAATKTHRPDPRPSTPPTLPSALAALDAPTRARWSPVGVEIKRVNEAFHSLLSDGVFTVQDEAAQLVTLLLDPQPADRVLDACAGLGGKTTHILEHMRSAAAAAATAATAADHDPDPDPAASPPLDPPPGQVVAVEPHAHRIEQLRDHVQRLHLTASLRVHHGTLHDLLQTPDADAAYDPAASDRATGFDRVLIDAPCTGLGTLRRHPEIRWTRTPDAVADSAQLQRALLDLAATCVRPGGVLVYSVCTWTQAEGVGQVVRFLKQHPDFALDLPDPDHPLTAGLDRDRWGITTWPDRAPMDSFFVTRLRRASAPLHTPAPS